MRNSSHSSYRPGDACHWLNSEGRIPAHIVFDYSYGKMPPLKKNVSFRASFPNRIFLTRRICTSLFPRVIWNFISEGLYYCFPWARALMENSISSPHARASDSSDQHPCSSSSSSFLLYTRLLTEGHPNSVCCESAFVFHTQKITRGCSQSRNKPWWYVDNGIQEIPKRSWSQKPRGCVTSCPGCIHLTLCFQSQVCTQGHVQSARQKVHYPHRSCHKPFPQDQDIMVFSGLRTRHMWDTGCIFTEG